MLSFLAMAMALVDRPRELEQILGQTVLPYSRIIRQRALWGCEPGTFCFNYDYYFVLVWLPLYLVNSRGVSLSELSVSGAVVYDVFALGAAIAGRASDHWIDAGRPVNGVRKAALLGVAGFMLTCASMMLDSSALTLGIGGFFFGLGSRQIVAIAQTLSGPRAGGRWMGIQSTIANLSGVIAPVVTGWTIEINGEYYSAFLVTCSVLVLGCVSWGLMVRRVVPIR